MPVNLETLEIQFKANTGGAVSNIQKLEAQAKRLKGGKMKVDADTKAALKNIEGVQDAANDLKDKEFEVNADVSNATSALGKLGKLLSTYGLLQGAKKVFTIAVDLVGEGYNKTSVNNRLEMLLPENAQSEIRAYADEMNKLYGLNETGLISMSTNFASAFVGMGVEADQAARYAERLSEAAIDYASALDKTPAEVSDTIMSLMRGNTAVADNIGLFGLTVDKLNKQAKELEAEGLVPKNMAEGTEKYIALLHEIERNADVQGFTGDWARTFNEYGNQTTALQEQWQTLKENVGTLLQPTATQIVQALNSIVSSVIAFTENLGKEDTLSETVKGYFGNYEMTEQEITDLVDSITKPTTDMVAAMQQSRTDLGKAYLEYDSALNGFVSLLNKLYVSGEPITDAQKENLFAAWDNAETLGIDGPGGVFDKLRETITASFTSLSGGAEGPIAQAGIDLITDYFDAMEAEAMRRSNELTTNLQKYLEDGALTSEEMKALQGNIAAVNEVVYENANLTAQGEMARYLDTQNFMPSSESWLAYYKEGRAAVDSAVGDLGKEYEDLEKMMYKAAAWDQSEYNRLGAEEYQKKYGRDRALTGAELMADAKSYREAQETQMQADLLNTVSRMGMSQMLAGITDTVKKGPMTNKDFIDQIMKPVLSQGDFVSEALSLQGKGAALSAETADFIALYQQLNSLIPEGKTLENILGEDAVLRGNGIGAMMNYSARAGGQDMYTNFARWLYGWDASSPWVEAGEMPDSLKNAAPESKRNFAPAQIIEEPSGENGFDWQSLFIYPGISESVSGWWNNLTAKIPPWLNVGDFGVEQSDGLTEAGEGLDGAAQNLNNAAAALEAAASRPVTVNISYTGGSSNYNTGRDNQNSNEVFAVVNGDD